jgi:predicted NBD/HSP70 family sugar kinase
MTPPKFSPNSRSIRGSNHNGMRQFNERIVLQAIRLHGEIPKADLARATHLSTQTVAIIVGRLLEDGLVIKKPAVRGKVGQPSIPLSLNADGAYGVGLHVGRRNLEIVITNFLGETVWTHDTRYEYPDPEKLIEQIKSGLHLAQEHMTDRWDRVVGLGVTAPLSMDKWINVMGPHAAEGLAKWAHYDFRAEVRNLTELPVFFAKDTIGACLAELYQGGSRGIGNYLYIFVGTFVGGALVLDGQLMTGQWGNAGAIGSLPTGMAKGTQPSQLLEVASGWQLEQALLQRDLDAAYVHSDEALDLIPKPMIDDWTHLASMGLAMTATSAAAFMDIDAVVIDGSLGRPLIDELIKHTSDNMTQYHFEGVRKPNLLAGSIGKRARALGGSLMPLYGQFFPNKDVVLKQDTQ